MSWYIYLSCNHLLSLRKIGIFLLTFSFCILSYANPVLDNVGHGDVSIQQTPNSTVVNQSSQKAIINWQSFNIGAQESTHFQQPAGGIVLNRISPTQGVSSIYGRLTATGQVILINPAGIFFGPGAYVNVGGLVASTANLSDQDFLNGNYRYVNDPAYSGSVINNGQIIAANHGLVALIGNHVQNNGLIQANMGQIVLASGKAFTMSFAGDQLINFTVDEKATTAGRDENGNIVRDGVRNTGSLIAHGGTIMVSAKAAQGVLDHMINMEGIVEAKSVSAQNGEIIFSGDPDNGIVRVAANVNASGKNAGETGGKVTVTGYNILVDDAAHIDVSGDLGGGDILIGGNYQGHGALPHANASVINPHATLLADALSIGNGGNIVVWSDNVTKAYGSFSAQGGAEGGNGGLIETSGHYLDVDGINVNTLAANGETGLWLLDPSDLTINSSSSGVTQVGGLFTADPNTTTSNLKASAVIAQLALTDVTVLTTSGGTGSGAGNITVASNLSWTSINKLTLSAYNNITINGGITISNTTSPKAVLTLRANNEGAIAIGSGGTVTNSGTINMTAPVKIYYNPASTAYSPVSYTNTGSGTVTGYMLINTASNLQTVSNTSSIWGNNFALSTNIDASGLSNFNPIGNNTTSFTGQFDGQNNRISNLAISQPSATDAIGLFGRTSGATISNLGLNSFTINATTNNGSVGTLIGVANGGTISNVYALNSTVTGGSTAASSGIGGLIGALTGAANLSLAYTSGGTVTGTDGYVGGLIGYNSATINTSYNNNTVSNSHANTSVGGLVGYSNTGSIDDAYSSGVILNTGDNSNVGGIVGTSNSATIARTLSTGYISNASTGSEVGGVIGTNNGTLTDSYWDSSATGMTAGVSAGTKTGATGGCFSGSGCLIGTANLSSQSTYTNWLFGTTWNIIEGQSYPYLAGIYTSTPRIISGTSSLSGNTAIALAANGTSIGTAYTGANGFFYFFESNGTIANSDNLLLYVDGSATKANAVVIAPTSGGSISGSTGLALTANTITVGNSASSTYTNSILSSAKGALSDTDILYSASGANLTLGNATNTTAALSTTGTSTYTVNGTIATTTGGTSSVSFGGPTTINTSSIATSGNQTYSGAVTVTANTSLTSSDSTSDFVFGSTLNSDSTPRTLSITYGDTATFSNNIGATNPFSSLQLTALSGASGNLYFNGPSRVTTSGNQSYTGNVNLANNIKFTSNAGDLTFSHNVIPTAVVEVTFNNAGSSSAINGKLLDSLSNPAYTLSIIKEGTGTLTLNNTSNSYTGTTSVNVGTLKSGAANVLPDTTAVTVSSGGAVLDLNGHDDTIGSLGGGGNVALGSATLTTGNGTNTTLQGVISGTGGSIVKNGYGNFTLSGANTYTGSTTINTGAIIASNVNSLSSSTVTVNSINGTGTLNVAVSGISNNVILNNGNLTYTGSVSYNGPVSLTSGSTLNFISMIPGNTFTLNGAINGGGTLTVLGNGGTLNVATSIGATSPLASLVVKSTIPLTITGNVTTTGAQSYYSLLTMGMSETFTGGNIEFLGGINGGLNLTVNGTGASFAGTLNVKNLTVTGTGGNNTVSVNSGNAQTWNITNANMGTITGVNGLTGDFTFTNMQNLTGGNNGNTFNFTNGALVNGTINGGSLNSTNTLNYTAYQAPLTVTLSSTNDGVTSSPSQTINGFSNITNLVLNSQLQNTLQLPNKTNTLVITGGGAGFLNDPIYFSGISAFRGAGNSNIKFSTGYSYNADTNSYTIDGTTMYFYDFSGLPNTTSSVADIIQQPPANEGSAAPVLSQPQWVSVGETLDQNINQIIDDVKQYDTNLNKVKINPYCSTATVPI